MNFEAMQAAIAQAAAEGPNMNEAQAGGGGDYDPPAQGMTRLRFISYIEVGVHMDGPQGKEKKKDLAILQFELSGPKHPPKVLDDGRKIPHIIRIDLPVYLNEKANFYKLFKRMNHTGDATHIAQLLGREYLGTVVHVTKGEGDSKKVYANLRDESGFTIRPPFVEDPETGESRRIAVDEAITPLTCFLWNYATKEMWDALYIDGKWDDKKDDSGKVVREGVSKNKWQNRIRAALNWQDSPMAQLLFAGVEPDLPASEQPERTEEAKQAAVEADAGAAGDPLAMVA
jgi:hypothetical protein